MCGMRQVPTGGLGCSGSSLLCCPGPAVHVPGSCGWEVSCKVYKWVFPLLTSLPASEVAVSKLDFFIVPAETHCTQDGPSPTPVPPSPSPPLVPTNPTVAKYNVTGGNGTCLLASMALQLNITYLKKDNNTVGGVGVWFIHERNMMVQVVVQSKSPVCTSVHRSES